MIDLETPPGKCVTEETPLVEEQRIWTRMDKILAVFGGLINLGHGVEMYLPGTLSLRNIKELMYNF